MKEYRAGIDIGSTTVKLVVLDAEDKIKKDVRVTITALIHQELTNTIKA